MITLTQQLADFQAGFKQRAAPERVSMMEQATASLRASGIESNALAVGAQLPNLTLPDASGAPVDLRALNRTGPLIVVFYRGGWCPYCNLELREWQRLLPELKSAGVQLAAISPQTPDNSLSTAEKNALEFLVLSDSSLAAAQAFGLAFELPPALAAMYASVGNDLPTLNGNGKWLLPVPATYVFDENGEVSYRHIDADYRQRAEPAEVLAHLRLHARGGLEKSV